MSEKLAVGNSLTRTVIIDKERTIGFMGEDARVYATPWLVHDIEHACRDLIVERTPEGEDSVGISVAITHMAPTLMDMEVEVTVTVAAIDGRKVTLDVSARDPLEAICKGTHERFVVNVDQTKQRLLAKAAKARES
jgi:fluoroacetyl-CoA thioesterase